MNGIKFVNVEYVERLIRRFKLATTPSRPDPYYLTSLILPVTNIDNLLKTSKIELTYDADPGATGWFEVALCPLAKRRELLILYATRSLGATITIDDSRLYDTDGVLFMPISSQTAGVQLLERFEQPIPWLAGQTIQIHLAAHNAGDKMQVRVLFLEEDDF